jgi:uncharacterized protein (TIGR00369 family)
MTIERVRRVAAGELPMPPSGQTLGLRLISVEEGSTTMQMPIDERFLNRGGGVQGGFLAALADANMGTAVGTVSTEGESHSTLEFKLNFVRPATAEAGPLTATSRVLYRGSRIAHVEADIRNSGGELVAKATSTWTIRKTDSKGEQP